MKKLKVYIAGKVSKNSVFGKHDWRDEFCNELEKLSGRKLQSFDPTKTNISQTVPEDVFGADAYMISKIDVFIVYLSDDISIGGSQEILIAKYFKKPVIGLAPLGGKFYGSAKEYFGKTVKDYRDPFVFSTCDVVCGSTEEVAEALKTAGNIKPKGLNIISELAEKFRTSRLSEVKYLKELEEDS